MSVNSQFALKNMSSCPFELAGSGTSVHACYSHANADNPLPQPVRSLQSTYSLLKSWQCAELGSGYTIPRTATKGVMKSVSSLANSVNVLSHAALSGYAGSGARKLAG